MALILIFMERKKEKGVAHTIREAKGSDQRCPLMPALYALAQHDGLVAANENLLPNELLLSFLGDLYIVTCRSRAYDAFQEVTKKVEECAGVRTHLGKLRVWFVGGGAKLLDIATLGPDVWTADKPDYLNGIKVLELHLGNRLTLNRS